jgi:hypothetical protein
MTAGEDGSNGRWSFSSLVSNDGDPSRAFHDATYRAPGQWSGTSHPGNGAGTSPLYPTASNHLEHDLPGVTQGKAKSLARVYATATPLQAISVILSFSTLLAQDEVLA